MYIETKQNANILIGAIFPTLCKSTLKKLTELFFSKSLLGLFCILPTLALAEAEQQQLSMLMSWNQNHSAVVNIPLIYIDEVRRLSGGQLSISNLGPEVVSPFEQLKPVSDGVFDLLFSHGLYHTGTTWVGASIDAIPVDTQWRRSSGVWQQLDRYYSESHNLKLLSIPTATTGFRFFLHESVPTETDLRGQTLRSLHTQRGLITSLSGTPALLPPAEIYSAVEKGVIDGLTWTSVGAYGLKFHEVAPQIVEPSFGNVSYLILMNLDSFQSLSESQQQILLDAGYQLERATPARFDQLYIEEKQLMLNEGAKIVTLKSLNQEEANERFAEEVWRTGIKYTGSSVEQLRNLVYQKSP